MAGISELQLPACDTATATSDLSLVCDLHHSSQQHHILNPLSEARDWAHNLMVPSWIHFPCAMGQELPRWFFLIKTNKPASREAPSSQIKSSAVSSQEWLVEGTKADEEEKYSHAGYLHVMQNCRRRVLLGMKRLILHFKVQWLGDFFSFF